MTDLISRQAAIDAMADLPYGLRGMVKGILSAVPSAQKTGKWIFLECREPMYDIEGVKTWGTRYRCPRCGTIYSFVEDHMTFAFCPNCGAKLEGEDDDNL